MGGALSLAGKREDGRQAYMLICSTMLCNSDEYFHFQVHVKWLLRIKV